MPPWPLMLHNLHVNLTWLCSQIPLPLHSLHRLFSRPCSHLHAEPLSLLFTSSQDDFDWWSGMGEAQEQGYEAIVCRSRTQNLACGLCFLAVACSSLDVDSICSVDNEPCGIAGRDGRLRLTVVDALPTPPQLSGCCGGGGGTSTQVVGAAGKRFQPPRSLAAVANGVCCCSGCGGGGGTSSQVVGAAGKRFQPPTQSLPTT